jgi:hypothetical protein
LRKDAAIFVRVTKKDYFNFVVITLDAPQKLTNRVIELQKSEKIIATHRPFFTPLRIFVGIPYDL